MNVGEWKGTASSTESAQARIHMQCQTFGGSTHIEVSTVKSSGGVIQLFFLHRVRIEELDQIQPLAALPSNSASLFDISQGHVSGLLGLPRCYMQNNLHMNKHCIACVRVKWPTF